MIFVQTKEMVILKRQNQCKELFFNLKCLGKVIPERQISVRRYVPTNVSGGYVPDEQKKRGYVPCGKRANRQKRGYVPACYFANRREE